MNIPQEMQQRAHEVAIEMANHIWHEHNHKEMPPHLWLIFEKAGVVDGQLEMVLNTANKMSDILKAAIPDSTAIDRLNAESLSSNVDLCIRFAMEGNHPKVESGDRLEAAILHSVDLMLDPNDVDGDMPPDLERDFAENLNSKVTQCLTTHVFSGDAVGQIEADLLLTPFSIEDGGVLSWGEHCTADVTEHSGAKLAEAIKEWFTLDRREVK